MAKKPKLIPLAGAADFKAKADEWAKLDNEIATLEAQLGEELTLVLFDIPTYCKAWIEDVITDSNYRGQGIGRALVERAIEMAKELGADSVNLTSRPSREVARALYRKVGFEEVPTTVFRLLLHD